MANSSESNKNGDKRGMSPNSQKNLGKGRLGNNHAKKSISITHIQREMMEQSCPYAKDPTWTWAYALAEAGMRDALTEEKARENLKDRMEGKVTQPIEAALEVRDTRELTDEELTTIATASIIKNNALRGSNRTPKKEAGS